MNSIISISLCISSDAAALKSNKAAEDFLNIFPLPPTSVIQPKARQLFPGSHTHHFLLQQQPSSKPYGFPRQSARQ